MTVEVRTAEELRTAMASLEAEILVLDEDLAKKLRAVKYVKALGPAAVAVVVGSIPIIIGTGGLASVGYGLIAPGAAWATSAIVALVVLFGGTIALSLFTDWEYVELPFGIKLRRKGK